MTPEQKQSDAERYRQHPTYGTDFSKPLSVLVEDIRNKMDGVRGLIHDIQYGYPGWRERVDHVEGLLTCGLVALYSSKEEIVKFEIKRDDEKFGKSLMFGVRGIGSDACPCCFVCGTQELSPGCGHHFLNNISAFVKSKEEGEEILSWFPRGAWLDFRPSEPEWIQLKVGACDAHLPNLEVLSKKAGLYGILRKSEVDRVLA